MLNELENKIRKAIPELMKLGDGCEFILYEKKYTITEENDLFVKAISKTHFLENYLKSEIKVLGEIIGKPIQLNHVLEYAIEIDYFTKDKLLKIIELWDLTKNLLSEQNEELIKYLNEL